MKQKQDKHKKEIFVISTLVIILIIILIYGYRRDNIKERQLSTMANEINKGNQKKDAEESLKKQKILDQIPGIVCWGDSLTAGAGGNGVSYPNVLQNLIKKDIYDIPIFNMGVGGEDTNTIIGRSGSVPFIVDAFSIPSDLSKVNIILKSSNGNSVAPLRQGDGGINPVIINGVEGTISIEQKSTTDNDAKYYFNRNTKGQPVSVNQGSQIITNGSKLYKDDIAIIFIGQNGGWKDANDLISQQKSIINTLGKNKDKFLILGLTTGTKNTRADLEQAEKNAFGDKYLNLREYLSTDGMKDANLTPTSEDTKAMNIGSMPQSLLFDKVHFNEKGYTLIGNIVYKQLVQLGYFDSIKNYLQEK